MPELTILLAGVVLFLLMPYSLGFVTRVIIFAILVLSLDLVLGYAGIATLGQAALYGTGAYAAGLFAVHLSGNPLAGLVVGAFAGAGMAALSGSLLMRLSGLKLLVMTIAVAQICQEVANKMRGVTGGSDGLSNILVDPLPGGFQFDFVGQTGYWYAFAVMMAIVLLMRVLTKSPLGLSARGIHQSEARMNAIGAPVYRRRLVIYTIGGAIAGIAGALSAQITGLVSIDALGFIISAEAVLMLVLGGQGRIYGAIIGAAAFLSIQHYASGIDPFNWLFFVGAMVLLVVMVLPSGLIGLLTLAKGKFQP